MTLGNIMAAPGDCTQGRNSGSGKSCVPLKGKFYYLFSILKVRLPSSVVSGPGLSIGTFGLSDLSK